MLVNRTFIQRRPSLSFFFLVLSLRMDPAMDEWTLRTQNPICRLFFKIDLLTDFGHCNRFYRQEIHSLMFGILDPPVNCCPHRRRNYTCVLLPLYLLSDLPPPPSKTKFTVYADNVWPWGVLNCAVDHILQKFYTLFLTRFRTYRISSSPQTKITIVKTTLKDWCL